MPEKLRIQFLAAEAAPLVKVGGLGDVAGSLPGNLRNLPEAPDVRVFLPYYPRLKEQNLNLKPVASYNIAHQDGPLLAQAFMAKVNGTPYYFIDGPPIASTLEIYSGNNHQDGMKFVFFSLAAMELPKIIDWQPDVLHAQDWHTAAAVYDLRLIRDNDDFFKKVRSLLTVHNLPYLGYGTEAAVNAFGLPRAHLSALPDWAEGLPLPLGLLTADKINTVSPGYAGEMLTPEFGAGLDNFLNTRKEDISGILNGLDLNSWDPETDPELPVNYSAKDIALRSENKTRLQVELGLDPNPEIPLLAMINRMDYQKGVDLVPGALLKVMDLAWQVVILGTGDPALEEKALQLNREYSRVRTLTIYDGSLARRIYGGSDLILIPSRYEPCGLTQMIGMRYGCVPLGRATGGLQDTIIDYHNGEAQTSTGFLFKDPAAPALAVAIQRALSVYQDKRCWSGLQRRGMKKDFSWERSAREYFDLYQELINNNYQPIYTRE